MRFVGALTCGIVLVLTLGGCARPVAESTRPTLTPVQISNRTRSLVSQSFNNQDEFARTFGGYWQGSLSIGGQTWHGNTTVADTGWTVVTVTNGTGAESWSIKNVVFASDGSYVGDFENLVDGTTLAIYGSKTRFEATILPYDISYQSYLDGTAGPSPSQQSQIGYLDMKAQFIPREKISLSDAMGSAKTAIEQFGATSATSSFDGNGNFSFSMRGCVITGGASYSESLPQTLEFYATASGNQCLEQGTVPGIIRHDPASGGFSFLATDGDTILGAAQ